MKLFYPIYGGMKSRIMDIKGKNSIMLTGTGQMTADSASFPDGGLIWERKIRKRHQLLIHAGKGETKTIL